MKILIVDNEKHVIDAIRMIVDWPSYGITEIYDAYDGEEAVRIIEDKQPDIVLTDMMMPNMHGKQLVSWIAEHASGTKVIVISGYSEFEYAQHAIRCGGIDYITKPIDAKQLEKAIKLAVKEVLKDREQNELIVSHYKKKDVYWDKLFLNMIHYMSPSKAEIEEIKKKFGIHGGAPVLVLTALVDVTSPNVKQQFAEDRQILYFALTNICRELLAIEQLNAYAFFDNTVQCSVKVVFWKNDDRIFEFIDKYSRSVNRIYKIQLFCGLSQQHRFHDGIYIASNESIYALEQRNLNGNQKYLTVYEVRYPSKKNYFQPIMMDLVIQFSLGQSGRVAQYINDIFDSISQEDYFSVGMLLALIDEYKILRVHLLETLLEKSDPNLLDGPVESLGLIQNHRLDVVKTLIIDDLVSLCKHMTYYNNLKKDVVYIIVNYIDENYSKTMSLQDLAKKFYLSREHLSRNFRKKIGVTITEYITNVRMDKAKELLQIEHLKIKDVANMVGYDDEKYFSKVFRQKYNETPNSFRKKL